MDVKVLASHIAVIVSEEERVFSSSYFNIYKVSERCLLLKWPCYIFSPPIVLQMEGISNMNDMRRHFRVKLKNVYTKLIRKFGQV